MPDLVRLVGKWLAVGALGFGLVIAYWLISEKLLDREVKGWVFGALLFLGPLISVILYLAVIG